MNEVIVADDDVGGEFGKQEESLGLPAALRVRAAVLEIINCSRGGKDQFVDLVPVLGVCCEFAVLATNHMLPMERSRVSLTALCHRWCLHSPRQSRQISFCNFRSNRACFQALLSNEQRSRHSPTPNGGCPQGQRDWHGRWLAAPSSAGRERAHVLCPASLPEGLAWSSSCGLAERLLDRGPSDNLRSRGYRKEPRLSSRRWRSFACCCQKRADIPDATPPMGGRSR